MNNSVLFYVLFLHCGVLGGTSQVARRRFVPVLFCTLLCAISLNGSTQPIKKQRTKGLPNPFSLLRARVRAHTHTHLSLIHISEPTRLA